MTHVIIDISGIPEAKNPSHLVQTALNLGFTAFLCRKSQRAKFHAYPNLTLFETEKQIILNDKDSMDFNKTKGAEESLISVINPAQLLNQPNSANNEEDRISTNGKALFLQISRELIPQQMEKVQQALNNRFFAVIVQPTDWKIIPLENLIAAFQQTPPPRTLLLAYIGGMMEDFKVFTSVLESGVDGVVFSPEDSGDLIKMAQLLQQKISLPLTTGKITKIKIIPSGDRVCIDTSSLLQAGEGLLVGNTAKGFVLVEAEVHRSEFVEPRPFRVNAGDVSEYLLIPSITESGKIVLSTKYLVEFKAGDEVWVVNSEGNCRKVAVSRVKIENRPLILFEIATQASENVEKNEFESKEVEFPITCQYAETVRLLSPRANSIPVSEIKVGDEILVSLGPSATHFGMPIKEKILEK